MESNLEKITDTISLITMESDKLRVVVSNYGCTITKIIVKNEDGTDSDVVLGYDNIEEYALQDGYLGALVGRVANRIKNGEFRLGDKTYKLATNNGPNHLHGGIRGFSYRIFDYEIVSGNQVEFHYLSLDGEEGYPGNLDLKAIYKLEGDTLSIRYLAQSEKDTLVDITNHSYFNLSGNNQKIDGHYLKIKAERYALIDENGLVTGKYEDVSDNAFDFNRHKEISKCLESGSDQIKMAKGIDHYFVFNGNENQVVVTDPESQIQLTVTTTCPGAQIYTGNYLDGRLGKYGHRYGRRTGICIETQHVPDAIHVEEYPSTLLKKGDIYDETTAYKFHRNGKLPL